MRGEDDLRFRIAGMNWSPIGVFGVLNKRHCKSKKMSKGKEAQTANKVGNVARGGAGGALQ